MTTEEKSILKKVGAITLCPNTVSILGTEWKITESTEEEEGRLKNCDAFTDNSVKEIVIEKFEEPRGENEQRDIAQYKKKVLRHEIVHAFLYESGLSCNSKGTKCWAYNEEMVDWIALQGIKIYNAWKDAQAI